MSSSRQAAASALMVTSLLVGCVSNRELEEISARLDDLQRAVEDHDHAGELEGISAQLQDLQRAVKDHGHDPDPAPDREPRTGGQVGTLASEVSQICSRWGSLPTTEEDKDELRKAREVAETARKTLERLLEDPEGRSLADRVSLSSYFGAGSSLKLGEPWPVASLYCQAGKRWARRTRGLSASLEGGEFLFPVLTADGIPMSTIKVRESAGEWTIARIGQTSMLEMVQLDWASRDVPIQSDATIGGPSFLLDIRVLYTRFLAQCVEKSGVQTILLFPAFAQPELQLHPHRPLFLDQALLDQFRPLALAGETPLGPC